MLTTTPTFEHHTPVDVALPAPAWAQVAAPTGPDLAPAAPPRVREQRHTERRHLRAVRLWRARQIVRTIPTDLPLAQYLQCRAYVAKAVSMFGRRSLSRMVWPWLPRQQDAGKGKPCPGRARRQARAIDRTITIRTPRGRTSNPTALP